MATGRTSKLTDSTTSRKTSFLRYRIPSDRHETAFVTAIGGRTCTSSLCDSCVMYLRMDAKSRVVSLSTLFRPCRRDTTDSCRILLSVVWG